MTLSSLSAYADSRVDRCHDNSNFRSLGGTSRWYPSSPFQSRESTVGEESQPYAIKKRPEDAATTRSPEEAFHRTRAYRSATAGC